MSDDTVSAILARIEARLSATGKTDRAASIEATGSGHAIRSIRKGSLPGVDVLKQLAPILDTTPEYLAFGVTGTEEAPGPVVRRPAWPPPSALPVIGKIAAGQWLMVDTEVDAPPVDDFYVPADPKYPFDQQFAVLVEGTSVNRVAPHGAVLGCLDLRLARQAPQHLDLVIVEQRRDGGHEIMRTAKRYYHGEDGTELWPDSDDPKWMTPLALDDEPEGVEVEVIGKVTFIHMPIDQLDRSRPVPPFRKRGGQRKAS